MCGILGIVGKNPVNQLLYDGLLVLQHRGQDAAGIVTCDGNTFFMHKNNGLVKDVFQTRHMRSLVGNAGIAHVRYPTAGSSSAAEAQPFYVAKTYATQLIPLLPAEIPSEQLKTLAAFVILFLAVLLIASLLCIALSGVIKKIGLNWLNRGIGALFGFARGLLIVCVLVFLAGLTNFPKDARWTNAMFSSPLEALVKSMLPLVPQTVAKHVKYD